MTLPSAESSAQKPHNLPRRLWRITAALALLFEFVACSVPLGPTSVASTGGRASATLPLTGLNGTVLVSDMVNTNLTVTYTPGTPVTSARLYVTPGNGPGLVVASQSMTNSGGTFAWSFSHPSFVTGAKISLCVLSAASGVETCVPQGLLSDANSWVNFTYGTTGTGFTVTFDAQGASVAPSPATKLVTPPATTLDALPTAPVRAGFTFLGWNTAADGTGSAFTQSSPVTQSFKVWAQWKASTGGLTLSGPNGSVVISAMTGSSLTATYTPTSAISSASLYLTQGNGLGLVLASQPMALSGGTWTYTFSHPTFTAGAKIGIDVLQNRSGVETNVPQGSLSNATTWSSFFYGVIPVTYLVTFDSQAATVPANPATLSVTSPATTVAALPTAPTKSGFSFAGWFTPAGQAFTASSVVTADLVVSARWVTARTWTVSFDSQLADTPALPSQVIINDGASLSHLPTPPQKTNFTFAGWYTEAVGGSPVTAATIVTSSITAFAHWQPVGSDTLLPLANGMHMTMQFNNKTHGAWTNDQIYLTMLARNRAGQWCWVKADGTLQPMSTGDNGQLAKNGRLCANYSLKLSSLSGFELPAWVDSGRVFVSMGSPLYLTVVVDGNGQIGYAAPDLNNATDPNADVYFDWYEFAIADATWAAGSPVGFWGNTTQVDQLSIPLLARVYEKNGTGGGTLIGSNGISESRSSLWTAWDNTVPADFRGLKNVYRINAPCKDKAQGFGIGGSRATYFDAYVNQIWDQYRTQDLSFRMDFGGANHLYTGRVQGDAFVFKQDGQGSIVAVARKPNATEIFEASGVLATGNTLEGAIQARIDAAFNRHVMQDSSKWDTPEAFYLAPAANYYAKFMHEHAVGGGAYGFAYDDVGNFSGALWSYNARAVVIDIGW